MLFATKDNFNLGASFNPMYQSLPCDTSLVSLKHLMNSDLMYDGTTINFHKNKKKKKKKKKNDSSVAFQ